MANRATRAGRQSLSASGQAIQQPGRSNPQFAIVALGLTAGIIAFDHLRGGGNKTQGSGTQTYVTVGLGAVLLVALSEVVPEVGVPLAFFLLMVVAIARPTGINFISGLLKGPAPAPAAGKAGANQQGTTIIAPNTGG